MVWKEEDHPRDGDGKFTDGNGSNPGKVKAALDRAGMNGLTRGHSGSILPGKGEEWEIEQTSGATSGAVDPDSERGQEHAERFYEEMRHRKDDISSIAKNTGFSKNDIKKSKIIFSLTNTIYLELRSDLTQVVIWLTRGKD